MPSAVPPAENGGPRSELEQLQMRAGQVTDEVCNQYYFTKEYADAVS